MNGPNISVKDARPLCIKIRVKTRIHTCLCSEKLKTLISGDRVMLKLNGEQEYGVASSKIFSCSHLSHLDLPRLSDSTYLQAEQDKRSLEEKEGQIIRYCKERASHYKLEMEMVKAEYALDKSKVTIYFTAEKRIDFREMVKDINNFLKSKTRVELWQVSTREKAVLIGGIGICGLEICCRKICQIPDTVSIRTVKDQHLEINPLKITGICGKLMCCLTYEHQQYVEMSKEYPKQGQRVYFNDKPGIVKSFNVLKATINVEFEEGITMEIKKDELSLGEE